MVGLGKYFRINFLGIIQFVFSPLWFSKARHCTRSRPWCVNDSGWCALIWVCSTFSLVQLGVSMPPWAVGVSLFVAGLLWRVGAHRMAVALIVIGISVQWSSLCIQRLNDYRLPAEQEGQSHWWAGEAVDINRRPLVHGGWVEKVQIRIECNSYNSRHSDPHVDSHGDSHAQPCIWPLRQVRVSRYRMHGDESTPIALGDRRLWRLNLKRPLGPMNPGSGSLDRFSAIHGIDAVGRLEAVGDSLIGHHWRWRVRHWMEDAIGRSLGAGSAIHPIFSALITGDRNGLSQLDWHRLQQTGTAHLLSISGLHVALIAGLAGLVIGALVHGLTGLRGSRPQWTAASAAVTAVLYGSFLGWTMPVSRAVGMTVLWALLLLLHRGHGPWLRAAWVLAAMTVWNPLALLAPGFWLSFAAVGILLTMADRDAKEGKTLAWRQALSGQLKLTLGLAPLLFMVGIPVSGVTVLANLVAVPIVAMWVLPAGLLGVVLVGAGAPTTVLQWILMPLDYLWMGLGWLTDLNLAWSPNYIAPHWCALALVVALSGSLLPWKRLAYLAVAIALMPRYSTIAHGEFDVHVWDVGQGTAVSVFTATHSVQIDTGRGDELWSAAEQWVMPGWRHFGRHHIDRLIVSHGDGDHAGGGPRLLQSHSPDVVMSNEWLTNGNENLAGMNHLGCVTGDRWQYDGVTFEILWPDEPGEVSGNDASCVVRVSNGDRSLLMMGDVSKNVEQWLVQQGRIQPADVIVVGHHGSRTSSSVALLNAVMPQWAVFTVGYRNGFGHPRPEVVDRWRARDSIIVRTDYSGHWHYQSVTNQGYGFRSQGPAWVIPPPNDLAL